MKPNQKEGKCAVPNCRSMAQIIHIAKNGERYEACDEHEECGINERWEDEIEANARV